MTTERVAVTGLAAILPGADGLPQAWRLIFAGRDEIKDVPPGQWLIPDYYDPDPDTPDRTYSRRGGFLPDVPFDPMAYGLPPAVLAATDSAQVLSLLVADEVLRDAGGPGSADRDRTSVILGATASLPLLSAMAARTARPHWLAGLRASGVPERRAEQICDRIAATFVPWREDTFPGLLMNVTAGRVASHLDLHGTNHTTDAACASSLAALTSAVDELSVGRADMVLAGGFDTSNDPLSYLCFSKTPALSRTDDCRPFSDQADGTVLGQGVVMLVLKRLADAERDRDRIYAVISGVGTSSDGRSKAIYAPLPEGQQRALRRAYQLAGYGPETVELVEAHGTGTKAGDQAEFTALRTVFESASPDRTQWCALGSIKSQIGHAKGAAGAAGLLKAVLALHHKVLPPTIKADRPNPELNIDTSPFYLNSKARPWVHGPASPRRASVSSFGFGGTNYHIALEEYQPAVAAPGIPGTLLRTSSAELLLFSANSAEELRQSVASVTIEDLAGTARVTQAEFDPAAGQRLAVVVRDTDDRAARLAAAAAAIGGGAAAPGISYACGEPLVGKVAFLFPGQGAQYPGMGADIAMHVPAARRIWDTLGTMEFDGEPLHRVVFPPPAFWTASQEASRARLTSTEWAQPALAVHALSLLAVLAELGLRPDCLAGHSFGELIALHAAGCYDGATLVSVGRRRGELMRDAAAGPSGMLAVSASAGRTRQLAGLAEGNAARVWIANSNAPDQTVLSGAAASLDAAAERLRQAGVAVTRLQASAAFHSPLVSGAVEPFAELLEQADIRAPAIPVYGNADAAIYPAQASSVRRRLSEHLVSPVLFARQVEAMYADGVRTFVEAGAAGPLRGLVGRILDGRPHLAVSLDRPGGGMAALYEALGVLEIQGAALDWAAHWAPYRPLPQRKQQRMTITINGGNYGRPYPPAEGVVPPPVVEESLSPTAGPDHNADTGGQPEMTELAARAEFNRQATQAHADFQRLMTQAHLAFLALFCDPGAAHPLSAAVPFPDSVPLTAAAPSRPAAVAAGQAPMPSETSPPAASVPPAMPAATPAAAPPLPADPDAGLLRYLLDMVADRTGYPVELIEPDMELEADLGVDSIKRVEILSQLRAKFGELKVSTAELAPLRTVREVAGKLAEHVSTSRPVPEPEAEPPPGAETGTGQVVTRFDIVTAAAPPAGLAAAGLHGGRVMVVDAGSGLARLVTGRLRAARVTAELVACEAEVPADCGAVVLLSGMAPAMSAEHGLALQAEAFRLARRIAARFTERGGLFVTVQDTGGDFGLAGTAGERAWCGGLAALARTALKEWPHAVVKAIDCERGARQPEHVADAIAAELLRGGPLLDVGLPAAGGRVTLTARLAAGPPGPLPVGPDSVLVVTGGGRGITARALAALARQGRPRLALLGRSELTAEPAGLPQRASEQELVRALAHRAGSPVPPAELAEQARRILAVREITATLAELEASGAQAGYHAVDIRDRAAVGAVLGQVREQWGPVTGLVHGAGMLADKLIADKTDEQFAQVFATKADGLRVLLDALASDPLDLLCLFSSVAASYGNAGQCDYAMANETIAQVGSAVAATRTGCQAIAIDWGPWRGGMVTPALASRFTDAGVALIGPAAGGGAFASALAVGGGPRVVIVAGGPGRSPAAALPAPLPDGHQLMPAEVLVRQPDYPQLADHAITGTPVLPMALVLDWLTGAARAWGTPGEDQPVVLRDVRVLEKAMLPDLAGTGHLLTITGTRDASGDVIAEVRDDTGRARYLARITAHPAAGKPPPAPQELRPAAPGSHYDGGTLFHGRRFQALAKVTGVGLRGARGTVAGLKALDWPGDGWQADPAALDGALQLALVWADRALGGSALPMAAGEVRVHYRGPLPGQADCAVLAVPSAGEHAQCHVTLTRDGEVLAEFRDLELVPRP